jgi:hypothetical protein
VVNLASKHFIDFPELLVFISQLRPRVTLISKVLTERSDHRLFGCI